MRKVVRFASPISIAMLLVPAAVFLVSINRCVDVTRALEMSQLQLPRSRRTATTTNPLSRICVLVEPSPFTYVCGYKNRFQALLQYLHDDPQTARVEIVTTEVVAPEKPTLWLGRFPIHYMHGFRCPSYPLMSMSLDWTAKAGRVIRQMRPDLIHVSCPGLLCLAAIVWSRLFRIPLVMSYHTHLPVFYRSYCSWKWLASVLEWGTWHYIRATHAFADLTVVTSPQVLQEFHQHKIRRVQVWQKGVETEHLFHPKHYSMEMRQKMSNTHPDDFLIVYVGRLGSEKRLQELRHVLEMLPPNVRLCLVGSGAAETELRQQFQDFVESGRCVFTGSMSGLELSQAFASGDCFCMPSDSETLGFVVLESMASGVPVVGVRAGGVQDLIQDGVNGYLVEPGDTKACAERVLRLQQDWELRNRLAAAARKETEQWSWTASMAKLRHQQYARAQANFVNRWSERLWRRLAQPRPVTTASTLPKQMV